jgi:hypothetical protein
VAGPLAFNAYTNCLKKTLHEDTSLKVFADDNKMFAVVDTISQSRNLQYSVKNWSEAAQSLDMKLSIDKCGVLHLGAHNPQFNYNIDGVQLSSLVEVKDLGVLITDQLRFSGHITQVVKKASVKANLILRSLIVNVPGPYEFLFMSLVTPTLLYGCEVWHPQFKKDMKLIQRVGNRFFRRVEFRCQLEEHSLNRPNMMALMQDRDDKLLSSLITQDRIGKVFRLVDRNIGTESKAHTGIYPKEPARSWKRGAQVASFYAWRVASKLKYKLNHKMTT